MKQKVRNLLIVSGLLILLLSLTLNFEKKEEAVLKTVLYTLKNGHYNPEIINNEFSEKVFKLFIERLDYSKRFFLAEDVKKMREYEYLIDDQIQNIKFDLLTLSIELLDKRIKETESYYQDILSEPFDFTIDEKIETDPEKYEYAKDTTELKEHWRKLLKYQTLTKLHQLVQQQEDAQKTNDTLKIKTIEELEAEAREKIMKSQDNFFRRLSQLKRDDRFSTYMNCIANCYDPHTGYFPPKDKENFDIAMSGQLEGIGATLQEKDGYIKVVRIIPGSASWRQGDLKAKDLILKVAQGEEDPVDVVDMRLDEAVQLIRGPKGTEVRLTVKKLDGSIVVIPIVRDIVVIEETYAKSAILKDKKEKDNIGYIYLPKFYADFKNPSGRQCANDVRKEVEKLKKEKVDGIIIDLRNNGGGSLRDVVKIGGLFIEKGPIVQIKARGIAPTILEDKDSKVVYDGPLVIMVNSFSASASEILAAAMQDYKRAVIVGDSSTFGKGTVQRFFGLNEFKSQLPEEYKDVEKLGAIKITIQKFYRINGGATQLKGVIPDIILPSKYSYIEIGEKEHKYCMPWTEIPQASYNEVNPKIKIDKITQKSIERVNENKSFNLIKENAKALKEKRDMTEYTLNYEKYKQESTERKKISKRFEDIDKNPTSLNVFSLQDDIDEIKRDTTKQAKTKQWHKQLGKDVHLEEAFFIMQDIL